MRMAGCGIGMMINLFALSGAVAEEPRQTNLNDAERDFAALHDAYLGRFKPLFIESATAWWEANTTGTDAAYERRKKAEAAMIELHSDRATFDKLRSFKEAGQVKDPVLARQLQVMYNKFLPGQVDPELQKKIAGLEADVEQIFNTHRGKVDGQEKTENDIRKILSVTKNTDEAEKAWKAYIEVGLKVRPKLLEAVSLRNQVAKELGFRDFFAMRLALQEIDEAELIKLFDELDGLTRTPFAALKSDLDMKMAERFKLPPGDLRPWNYGDLFFQDAPDVEEVSLDEVLKDRDLIAMTKSYYESMGMDLDDVLARSDLYEKPGKSPHAFCTDIDRTGENVRVLCNLKPNAYWADTLVHEMGHAVYCKYLGKDLPFILKEESHALTTEGIANMLGAMVKNEDFLRNILKLPENEVERYVRAMHANLRAEKLIFTRWTQVMMRFERAMYGDPQQDLSKLWWDLKRQYQMIAPPDDTELPGFGAKIHVVTVPVYYHSYMMGDLFACQIHAHVARNVLKIDEPSKTAFVGSKAAGDWLREKIFAPGNLYPWNELTRHATGEPLTAKYFARQYVN